MELGPDINKLLRANTPEEMRVIAKRLAEMHPDKTFVDPNALAWAYVIGKLADLTERLDKTERKLAVLAAQNGMPPNG